MRVFLIECDYATHFGEMIVQGDDGENMNGQNKEVCKKDTDTHGFQYVMDYLSS